MKIPGAYDEERLAEWSRAIRAIFRMRTIGLTLKPDPSGRTYESNGAFYAERDICEYLEAAIAVRFAKANDTTTKE